MITLHSLLSDHIDIFSNEGLFFVRLSSSLCMNCENIGQLVDLFYGLIAHLHWVMILSKQRGTFNRVPPYFHSKMITHGSYAYLYLLPKEDYVQNSAIVNSHGGQIGRY